MSLPDVQCLTVYGYVQYIPNCHCLAQFTDIEFKIYLKKCFQLMQLIIFLFLIALDAIFMNKVYKNLLR